jgi:predicted RNase H-like nuclease (RuvC/YqgF family)
MNARHIAMNSAAALLGAVLMSVPLAVGGEAAKECSGPTCSGACAIAGDSADRERLGEMVDRQRDELDNLTRAMAVERAQQAQLEAELASARAAAAKPPVAAPAAASTSSLEEENRRLRLQVDLQREENEKLAAKLHTASKVAELVFRAEAEASAAPAPVGEEPQQRIAPQAPSDDHVPAGWARADFFND